MSVKLSKSYYQKDDVVFLAKDLLGKRICSYIDGCLTTGIISETEAYRSWGDKACHAHLGRRTRRTEAMFENGGVAYVYLCYGIHTLFNVVTNRAGRAEAILIRSMEPQTGVECMQHRRGLSKREPRLSTGPGNLSKCLGISTAHYGLDLTGDDIWLEESLSPKPSQINVSPRIGVDYAGEDALRPWRFFLYPSNYVSHKTRFKSKLKAED